MSTETDQPADTGDSVLEPPPLPWRINGSTHLGVFTLARPLDMPHGVTALAARRVLIVATRVHGRDVRYDSMLLSTVARRGRRVGLVFHCLWIDKPSVRRAVWESARTPSDSGSFTWSDTSAKIMSDGSSVGLSWQTRTRLSLPLPANYGYFIWDGGHVGYLPIPGWAKASPMTMRISHWPENFPELTRHDSSLALHLNFSMTAHLPRMIDSK